MQMDPDVLRVTFPSLMAHLPGGDLLTPAERVEVVHLAQGLACKESAAAMNISASTVLARRKHIYRKLRMSGANELIARLLAVSLQLLGRGERAAAVVEASAGSPSTRAGPSRAWRG